MQFSCKAVYATVNSAFYMSDLNSMRKVALTMQQSTWHST
jgi:hypothetical protein